MSRVGIFGGSYNPIHNGHISIAEELLQTGFVDEIWFVISPQNPLKQKADLWPDELRFEIAEKALEAHPRLKPCDVEFHLSKPSYMWTTLNELRSQYPDNEFVLLIGADNWLLFSRWYRSDDILKEFELGIYPRPGYNINVEELPENVQFFNTGLYDISSTEIRRRLKDGESIEGLVPKSVIEFLDNNWKLYSSCPIA